MIARHNRPGSSTDKRTEFLSTGNIDQHAGFVRPAERAHFHGIPDTAERAAPTVPSLRVAASCRSRADDLGVNAK